MKLLLLILVPTFVVCRRESQRINDLDRSCKNYYDESGVCVAERLCKSLPGINSNRSRTFWDLLIMDGHYCDRSRRFVCCDRSQVIINGIRDRDAFDSNNLLPVPGENKCGTFFTDRIARQGFQTSTEEFPWMALLQYSYGQNDLRSLCSGVLINDRYVLTAGHCVTNLGNYGLTLKSVRFGEWNTSTSPDCYTLGISRECSDPEQDVSVEKVVVHRDYLSTSQPEKDIALVRLSRPVKISMYVKPICLPLSREDRANIHHKYTTTGWKDGATQVKMTTNVNKVSIDWCNNAYNSFTYESSSICTSENKNATFTDNGGALMATHNDGKGNNYFYAAGILSYVNNRPCLGCSTSVPRSYTKVSNFIKWIQENIEG